MTSAKAIAAAMGGEARGDTAYIPSPGHSKRDRGTAIKVDPDAPGGVLVHSFNGADALGIKDELRDRGLIPPREQSPPPAPPARLVQVATFDYADADGAVLYRTVRLEPETWSGPGKKPKEFRAQRWENGRWIAGIKGVRRVPYRLPELVQGVGSGQLVYLVEGERKADYLASKGRVATAVAFGADGWLADYASHLKGARVCILPDNDNKGRGFARNARADIVAAGGKAFVLELAGLPEKGDILDWQGEPDELDRLSQAAEDAPAPEWLDDPQPVDGDNVVAFKATPFSWPNPSSIPRRCWLFGYWLLRGEITAIVAPGGVGKSTFTTAAAVSMASGRDFLEKTLPEGALSVWLWKLEDGREELDRQVSACALHHGITAADCGGRLYVDSGLDQRLCTATETADGVQIIEPVYEALKAEIELRGIDVLIVDPFVSSHEVDENMNAKVDRVAKRWKRLATETNCAIVLVHHTKKMGGREVKAEDSRGAVALINAARSTLVFNPMSREEAERFGITDRAEQRRHVRIDDDKPNRAPPESAWWMKLASVDLGNGNGLQPSDKVGAATPWSPPDPFDGLSVADLYAVQQAIDGGEWAHSVQANDWVGHAVAQALGLNASDKTDKARIGSLLRGWIETQSLVVERRSDPKKGREKPFVVVGKWVDPACLPTSKSGVGNVG